MTAFADCETLEKEKGEGTDHDLSLPSVRRIRCSDLMNLTLQV